MIHLMSSTKLDCIPRERSTKRDLVLTANTFVSLPRRDTLRRKLKISTTIGCRLQSGVFLRCPPSFDDVFEGASAVPFKTSPTGPLERVMGQLS